MGNINLYQEWLTSALFWLGFCITLFGVMLLMFPGYCVRLGYRLNRWVSTESFFQRLDKPHYRENLFYRWHTVFGLLVVLASVYIIYMFLYRTDIDALAMALPVFHEYVVNQWLYEAISIFFTAMSIVTLCLGLVITIRPSLLKRLETWSNRWIETDKSLQRLNNTYDIPENILPGNVRLFGTFVLLGGAYMMFRTLASVV